VLITWIGHSTVLIELDGVRLLTDPVLRPRVAHLVRDAPAVEPGSIGDVALVLVSHMHHDHFDPASIRLVEGSPGLIAPQGTRKLRAARGLDVAELGVGESSRIDGITITATPALHRRGRLFDRRTEAIGFTITGSNSVYFAGDTDVFPEMAALRGGLDVGLLPVGGWGPRLGPGHMDPKRAADSLALLEPRVAIPIHWGTLRRFGLRRSRSALVRESARAFAREAARVAPSVDVRVLAPGESTLVERAAPER
jgi:L-ascorbate metabolism protein UlaG (beta-lactamase superfamily)